MPQNIDHIVVAVRDLAEGSTDYAEAGFTVTPGGEHTGGATHNALVSFVDGTYFELIAIKDPAMVGDHRWFSELEKGDGSVAFALGSADLSGESDRLSGNGLSINGPRDGGRLRPDGQRVDWRTLQLQSESDSPLPFLIQDVTPRVLRVPDGAATKHPLGEVRVAGVTLAVGDLEAVTPAFTSLLGAGKEIASAIPGVAKSRRFTVGSQWVDLAEPADGASEIGAFQRNRGDGVYQITLAGGQNGRSALPSELTHGVRIEIES